MAAGDYLLDTHALIWWWLGDPMLSRRVQDLLSRRQGSVHVSAVAGIEIALKVRAGRLPAMAEPLALFEQSVDDDGFRHLPVDHRHAIHAGLLDNDHKDPFDRLLAAQALLDGMTVITCDPKIAAFGCDVIW